MTLQFIRLNAQALPANLAPAPGMTLCDPALIAQHRADAHLVASVDGIVFARCSLWWRDVPALPGETLGAIGHFAAAPDWRADRLIRYAYEELAHHGASIAVGPMDGNTWRSYRLVSDAGTAPPFFLEPWTPMEWNEHFRRAGFTPFATYHSSITHDLAHVDPRVDAAARRLHRNGVHLRNMETDRFAHELERIYALSLISFADNVLYSPIGRDEFIAQYLPIERYLDPRVVLIAERDGELAGFLFAVPDLLEAKAGTTPRTVILKTVAVRPGRKFAGLGAWMAAECHARAAAIGYVGVVHALMHDDNNSANISRRYAACLRRYTLYSRQLTTP